MCKIETIANLMCMNKCPMVTLDADYNAHTSQKNHVNATLVVFGTPAAGSSWYTIM